MEALGSATASRSTVSVGIGGSPAGPVSLRLGEATFQIAPSGARNTAVNPANIDFVAGLSTVAPPRSAASSTALTSAGCSTMKFSVQPPKPAGSGAPEPHSVRTISPFPPRSSTVAPPRSAVLGANTSE